MSVLQEKQVKSDRTEPGSRQNSGLVWQAIAYNQRERIRHTTGVTSRYQNTEYNMGTDTDTKWMIPNDFFQ